MGVINRDLHPTQQRDSFPMSFGALATGVTQLVSIIPFNCWLDAAQVAAFGTSGTPTIQLYVHRFIMGTGFTNFVLGSTVAMSNFGTSGVLSSGYSLPAQGSTLLQLQANDCVMLLTGGSNAAVAGLTVSLVLRPTQDLTTYFGITGS